jgi:hypothetical protein
MSGAKSQQVPVTIRLALGPLCGSEWRTGGIAQDRKLHIHARQGATCISTGVFRIQHGRSVEEHAVHSDQTVCRPPSPTPLSQPPVASDWNICPEPAAPPTSLAYLGRGITNGESGDVNKTIRWAEKTAGGSGIRSATNDRQRSFFIKTDENEAAKGV